MPYTTALEVVRNRNVALEDVVVLTLHPGDAFEKQLRPGLSREFREEHTGDVREGDYAIGRTLYLLPRDAPGLAEVRASLAKPAPAGHFWHLRIEGERIVAVPCRSR